MCVCVFVRSFVCLSGFELYYNSMNAFIVEINFDIVVSYKLKYYVNGNSICQ